MEWTSNNIRQAFLDFFSDKQHEVVASAPIVIKNDPTLMFTNAGMNQFKGIFLGTEEPRSKRVVDSQKCLRVSGKHNDLEEVGRDHYHHTMFEMLGNWSFGDYFKAEAIEWGWKLLTEVYQLDKSRIYVTVFGGDKELGLDLDQEAVDLWANWIDKERILPFGKKDNFWEMGETGPCGPCSEIHFDLRSDEDRQTQDGAELVNADHPGVIEIWNLVFMQFDRKENGTLDLLKHKHIDTGLGLERLARVLQGAKSNYDIDLFSGLIDRIASVSGKAYGGTEETKDVAFRVIADHVRAVSFCIADGQLPSNTGAGYVVRRVLRRAIRYGFSQLGMKEPFIHEVAQKLIEEMGGHYPELNKNKQLITKVILEEEKSFLQTLDKGLERIAAYMKENSGKAISGEFAFELYDTYGFPIDLTRLIASEQGVEVEQSGFETELQKQKDRSRKASKAEFGDWVVLQEGVGNNFTGYDSLTGSAQVLKYRRVKLKGGDSYQIVLSETPFYAESGGQIGDKGQLVFESDETVKVLDTKKEHGDIIHFVQSLPDNPEGSVQTQVAGHLRNEIRKNHSATHLLHYTLRDRLGTHVEQKGSLVADDRLRFDFSHFEKITQEQLEEIEKQVIELISVDTELQEWRAMPIEEAKQMGAMALFGEKYGDQVRVVKFGDSVELCGGTHVGRTSEIGGFKVISEASIASGIRRIEALTGKAYEQHVRTRLGLLTEIEELVAAKGDVVTAIKKLQQENKALTKEREAWKQKEQQGIEMEIKNALNEHDGYRLAKLRFDELDGKVLKEAAHHVSSSGDDIIIVAGSTAADKVSLVVAISKSLQSRLGVDASKVIKEVSPEIAGGGGGQNFLAMAGGKNKQGLHGALEKAEEIIRIQAS